MFRGTVPLRNNIVVNHFWHILYTEDEVAWRRGRGNLKKNFFVRISLKKGFFSFSSKYIFNKLDKIFGSLSRQGGVENTYPSDNCKNFICKLKQGRIPKRFKTLAASKTSRNQTETKPKPHQPPETKPNPTQPSD